MSYFHNCPNCGAALDPGEVCDRRTQLMSDEMARIYQGNKGDSFGIMRDAYNLGYAKAELHHATQKDAPPAGTDETSQSATAPHNLTPVYHGCGAHASEEIGGTK